MNKFTITIPEQPPIQIVGKSYFFMCDKCWGVFHGPDMQKETCTRCMNGILHQAVTDPDPPPIDPIYMVCDSCNYIITGRRTRLAHHSRCECRTVHKLFKEDN